MGLLFVYIVLGYASVSIDDSLESATEAFLVGCMQL